MNELKGYRLALILCVPFVWALSNSMLIPILPRVQQSLDISRVQAGLIITALSVPVAIFLPFSGFLSDRYGRINVMSPAIFIYGLGGLMAALAAWYGSYYGLLAARGLQGIGATGTHLLALSLIGDSCKGQRRTKIVGYLEGVNSLGKFASPLIGSALATLIWFAPFFAYPLLCFPLAVGLYFTRPKQAISSSVKLSTYLPKLFTTVWRKKQIILSSLSTALIAVFIWFGNLFFLSETMSERFTVSGFLRGLLLSIPILALAISSVISGRYLKKISPHVLCSLGLIWIALTLVGTLVLPGWFLLYASVALVGVGLGIVLPCLNTLVVGCVTEDERGVLAASYGSVRALGSALGPVSFGLLMQYGDSVALLTAAGLALFGAFIMFMNRPSPQSGA